MPSKAGNHFYGPRLFKAHSALAELPNSSSCLACTKKTMDTILGTTKQNNLPPVLRPSLPPGLPPSNSLVKSPGLW